MNKETVPQDFTLSLAIFDSLPVIFFTGSMIIIGFLFKSKLFLLGALLCLLAGLSKVIWKMIVVLKRKNIWFLFVQMRTTMPIGFLLMIVSLIVNRKTIVFSEIFSAITSFPSAVFFALGIIGMIMMLAFGFTLDGSKKSSNWIEQVTNCIAQLCFFIGLLMM